MMARVSGSIDLGDPRIVAEREWLREFARWAKGDPNLTREEAEFLAKMARYSEATDATLGAVIASKHQAEIVRELADRLGYATDAPVRPQPDCEDDEPAYASGGDE